MGKVPAKRAASRDFQGSGGCSYLPALPSWLDTFENVFFNWPPSVFTVAMMATEMPAAMRPYSMAIAPDSSRRKRAIEDFMECLLCERALRPPAVRCYIRKLPHWLLVALQFYDYRTR